MQRWLLPGRLSQSPRCWDVAELKCNTSRVGEYLLGAELKDELCSIPLATMQLAQGRASRDDSSSDSRPSFSAAPEEPHLVQPCPWVQMVLEGWGALLGAPEGSTSPLPHWHWAACKAQGAQPIPASTSTQQPGARR